MEQSQETPQTQTLPDRCRHGPHCVPLYRASQCTGWCTGSPCTVLHCATTAPGLSHKGSGECARRVLQELQLGCTKDPPGGPHAAGRSLLKTQQAMCTMNCTCRNRVLMFHVIETRSTTLTYLPHKVVAIKRVGECLFHGVCAVAQVSV